MTDVAAALAAFEQADPEEQAAVVAFVAGRSIAIDDDELNGPLRRAELLLAAGGDPRRAIDLDHRAVTSFAADLATPPRVATLAAVLDTLHALLDECPRLREVAAGLRADPQRAWLVFAHALLTDRHAGDDDTEVSAAGRPEPGSATGPGRRRSA